ncbi:Protein of unknown function (DUF581 [Striga hermonthica]|uniref:FLZ-type domain-containing protein n=1 Tax=Striga hermonthica TaxID=68872 RepID=A0A9N7RCY0_STRHE|nr:Protein of unknown function (DUF581 [Striga hermonthica]
MTLGKRGRPAFRRAASTAEVTFDVGIPEATVMAGGEFDNGYYRLLSPRYLGKNFSGGGENSEPADFLRSCGLCHRRLATGRDIYMYRGDTAFCSLECREQQMNQDERKERRAGMTKDDQTQSPEVAAAATEAKTMAAA